MITLPEPDGLMVVLLVTNRCQLQCSYCELDQDSQDMPLELVARVMEDIHRLVPLERPVTFAWHGGEPLMLGLPFYRWVYDFQAEMRKVRKVRNYLQTNGLLLNDAFLDLLVKTGDFRPNISMDGPDTVTRRTRGVGAARYERLFEQLKARGIEFGISVAGSPELAEHRDEVLAYFQEHGLDNIGVTVFQATRPEAGVSPTLLSDITMGGDPGGARVNALGKYILQGMQDMRLRSECRLSSFSGHCHRHVVCIDPKGEVSTCLRGQWSGLWNYGNASEQGLDTWWASTSGPPPFRPQLPRACEPCVWKDACQGGCPSNAKAMNGGADQPDFYCESFKRLFQAAQDDVVKEMCALVEKGRKGRVSPDPS